MLCETVELCLCHTLEFDPNTYKMPLVPEKRALDLEEERARKKGRLAGSEEEMKAQAKAQAKAQEMMAEHPELFADNYKERLQKTHEFARRVFLSKGLDKRDKKVRI